MCIAERFRNAGEFFAAGLFEEEDRSLFFRKSRALRRYWENVPLPPYEGKRLYPAGVIRSGMAVTPHYCFDGFNVDIALLQAKDPALPALMEASGCCNTQVFVPPEHTVAGDMYNHGMPNYERILAEGFDGYEARIRAMADADLREGLLEVVAGIRAFHARCLAYLREVHADPRLIAALETAPMHPCETFEQAVVGWNFALYLDGCDNLGSVAQGLMPYYRGEDAEPLLSDLFDNLDENGGYSMAVGIRDNPLVVPCLRAVRGKRRPMIELFADEDTPEEVWAAALDCVFTGGGQPAFYNRKLYTRGFAARFPSIDGEDLARLCGGGCTEMMLPGLSHVGSLDAGVNLLLILERTLHSRLESAESFSAFYETYIGDVHTTLLEVMEGIRRSQAYRAENCPLPMRTLLVDDCIEKEQEYNAGGARYAWSIISYAGIVNVLDSLAEIRRLVFDEKIMTAGELLEKLRTNDPAFLAACRKAPHRHGTDDEAVCDLAHDFTSRIFAFTREMDPYIGLGFLPASILFQSYGAAGMGVGATPCGRGAGEPLADSLTAVFGKDTLGPTAMLKSVTSMDLAQALGTPVCNLTVSPSIDRHILRSLILAYMRLGGMQLQITCVSRETLEAAYADPDSYRNLVVRVGGYSEYFYRLDDTLKRKILERTYYA